jgi:hypothetical protein
MVWVIAALRCRNNVSYSVKEQVFLVKMYWIMGSPSVTQKEFKKWFGGQDDSNETTVCCLEEKGSLVDKHGKH